MRNRVFMPLLALRVMFDVIVSADLLRPKTRNVVTRESVVSAALAVVDEVGVNGVTIRALATAVGSPTMSLYAHFSTKEELLDLMYQEVVLRLWADNGHPTWQAELLSICHQIRRTLLEHPRWPPLLHRPARPMVVPARERILALMAEAGIPADDALTALSNAGMLSTGFTLVELGFRAPDGQSSLTMRFDMLKEWSENTTFGQQHPQTHAALAQLEHLDLGRSFDAAARTFIAGVAARFSR